MERSSLTLLLLAVCIGLSQQQISRCLLSRLDNMPCQYRNPRLERASKNNEYSIHQTNLKSSGSGSIECRVRPIEQIIKTITNVGTNRTMVIFSPGFRLGQKYANQLLGQYNIDCGEGHLAFFNLTKLDMQGDTDCKDSKGRPRCQDYLLIDRGLGGTNEICGNSTSNGSTLELQSRDFTVFFRSSEEVEFGGFEMYIVCFRVADRDQEGCLRPIDFNSSVCSAGSGGGELFPDNTSGSGRRKRDTYADGVTYKDIFPGYPSGLRMREDVANFHNLWRRRKRQAGIRFVDRIVFFNESVNYTDSTIRIADTDGTETGRYEGIFVLQTFDAEGKINHYVLGVDSEVYPHFFGPGPLVIVDRYAYFQLFIIDPRGLIPDPEEEQELERLNEPLLGAVPDSADVQINATNDTLESFAELGIQRRKRAVSELLYPYSDPASERVQRQAEETSIPSVDTIFLALRNREACNPVLRQQALSLIALYNMSDTIREMVEELQNFTINCTLKDNKLNCMVDEGYAPALDKFNYCTFTFNNDRSSPQMCDPFYDTVTLRSGATSVTVEAINCKGQRVKKTVNVTESG